MPYKVVPSASVCKQLESQSHALIATAALSRSRPQPSISLESAPCCAEIYEAELGYVVRHLPPHRCAGGIRRKLLLFLVLVVVVVALLPTIIAKTPLRNVLLSAAMPSNAVRVSIGGASLSWISGPTLSGVQINDAAGNTLLTADSISADRAPINLLLNSLDLGAIRINRPEILLKVRPDGSNLEDALQQLVVDLSKNAKPPSAKQSPGSQFAFALQLVDGTILAEDVATGRVCRIEGVNLQYDCHGSGGGIGNGSLAGQIAIAGPRARHPPLLAASP